MYEFTRIFTKGSNEWQVKFNKEVTYYKIWQSGKRPVWNYRLENTDQLGADKENDLGVVISNLVTEQNYINDKVSTLQ